MKSSNFSAIQFQKIGKSEIYESVFIYKDPKGQILYRGRCNRNKRTFLTKLVQDEKEAALMLDKALIKAGQEPINILKKK